MRKEGFEVNSFNRLRQRIWLAGGAGTLAMAGTFLAVEAVRLGTGNAQLPPAGLDVESLKTLLAHPVMIRIAGEGALAAAGLYQVLSAHAELTADAIDRRARELQFKNR